MAQNRTVLIVGASSGIGLHCARHLNQRGWNVIGTSRSGQMRPGDSTSRESSGDFPFVVMNVDSDASVAEGMKFAFANSGRLDAVINAAGWGLGGAIEETSIEEAKALFETNFFGALRVCHAALPILRDQGHGRIIQIGSLAGQISLPYEGIYSATKAALGAATESLRMEAKPHGIWVSLIEPGDFKTGFTDARRMASGAAHHSAHHERRNRTLSATAQRESSAPTPQAVARLAEKILHARSPRLRYRVGPGSFSPILRGLLPQGIAERILERYFFPGE